MGSLDEVGAWCPECRDQYRPGFTICADCQIPLVEGTPPPRPKGDARDHEVFVYDLGALAKDDREALELLLTVNKIPHEWLATDLNVPNARRFEVDSLIDTATNPPAAGIKHTSAPKRRTMIDASEAIAGPGRRLIGATIDGVVAGLLVSLSVVLAPQAAWSSRLLFVDVAAACYVIVGTALWGRTIGKLVAGTRVIVRHGGRLPGWGRAFIRWGVPSAFYLSIVGSAFGTLPPPVRLLGRVWPAVVYGAILASPLRQGIHDRFAGTVVVLT